MHETRSRNCERDCGRESRTSSVSKRDEKMISKMLSGTLKDDGTVLNLGLAFLLGK